MVDTQITQAADTAEWEETIDMDKVLTGTHRMTVGADKNYDTKGFVKVVRDTHAAPHDVAQNTSNRSVVTCWRPLFGRGES